MKKKLMDMTLEELTILLKEKGQPSFRAKQIFSWISKGVGLDAMSNVPKSFRNELNSEYTLGGARIIEKHISDKDGTIKYLFSFEDRQTIEGVLMKYKYGNTLCVSTQIGCRMGCEFCASTIGGRIRNLTAGEILGQVVAVNSDIDEERGITNIVLMGSGEPLDNYDNVVKFLRLVHHVDGLNISYRNISLSTCGLIPKMNEFTLEGIPLTLSISLHASDDYTRGKIMPIAKRYTIKQTLDSANRCFEKTGRRIIIEYAMISSVNDSRQDAKHLAEILRGLCCHVNIIPLNRVDNSGLYGSDNRTIDEFISILKAMNISVTRRREMGTDIEGACGQLRRRYENNDN